MVTNAVEVDEMTNYEMANE
jgi:hypothetical protein